MMLQSRCFDGATELVSGMSRRPSLLLPSENNNPCISLHPSQATRQDMNMPPSSLPMPMTQAMTVYPAGGGGGVDDCLFRLGRGIMGEGRGLWGRGGDYGGGDGGGYLLPLAMIKFRLCSNCEVLNNTQQPKIRVTGGGGEPLGLDADSSPPLTVGQRPLARGPGGARGWGVPRGAIWRGGGRMHAPTATRR